MTNDVRKRIQRNEEKRNKRNEIAKEIINSLFEKELSFEEAMDALNTAKFQLKVDMDNRKL